MPNQLTRIHIENFRCLENVTLDVGMLNVMFGPNGVGKSTFLDTLWFVRDCAIRGVDAASSDRDHGIGILWHEAEPDSKIKIQFETDMFNYAVEFGFSSGRIEAFAGENLFSKSQNKLLIHRTTGSDKADFYNADSESRSLVALREPEKLALKQYLYYQTNSQEANDADRLLRCVHSYQTRSTDIYGLKKKGSESGTETWMRARCSNLWSVLRNLKDRRGLDDRYDTIMDYMRRSFPFFDDVLLESTGPNTVYGSFIEKYSSPVKASGVSDGHLQLLIHLTCLFAEGRARDSILIFDEPETALHPHAISVFADAVILATKEWNKQVYIATHSPVLLSHFAPDTIIAVEMDRHRRSSMRLVSEIEGIKDLLEDYAAGSLYIAEVLAPQSHGREVDE